MWTTKRESKVVAALLVSALSSGCSGSDEPSIDEAPDLYLAGGITLTRVEALQALAVPVVADERAVDATAAPIVRNFPTTLRVGGRLSGDASARSSAALAVAILEQPGGDKVVRKSAPHAPQDYAPPSLASTWQIPLEANDLREGTKVRVVIADANMRRGSSELARFPRDASSMDLATQPSASLDLMLVPFRWVADGSNRLPDMSEQQIASYRSLFERVYPATKLNLTIHEPVDAPSRGSFSAYNDALLDLRSSEDLPGRVYVHGLVAPADSFDDFCRGGCTTGLGFVVDDDSDGSTRVSSGVGFTGRDSGWTMIHEVGHQHGREHAPCGVSGADRGFPQRDGTIGLWGFDRSTPTMLNITSHDFMSYCEDEWVSQYTWAGLLTRIQRVGAPVQAREVRTPAQRVRVRLAHRDHGRITFIGAPIRFRVPPSAPTEAVTLELASGARAVRPLAVLRTGEADVDDVVIPAEGFRALVDHGERIPFDMR